MMSDKVAKRLAENCKPSEFRSEVNDIANLTFVGPLHPVIRDRPPLEYLANENHSGGAKGPLHTGGPRPLAYGELRRIPNGTAQTPGTGHERTTEILGLAPVGSALSSDAPFDSLEIA